MDAEPKYEPPKGKSRLPAFLLILVGLALLDASANLFRSHKSVSILLLVIGCTCLGMAVWFAKGFRQ